MSQVTGVTWQCPKCPNKIGETIKLSEPPKCTRHTGGAVTMKPTSQVSQTAHVS